MAANVAAPRRVTYWAVSILSSRTFWFNWLVIAVAVLTATDVLTVIPVSAQPVVSAIVAAINIYLRTVTTRPVAFIAPGETKPVAVPMVDPPAPRAITD